MSKGRLDAISEYKASGNGVLFASDSCGEDIDIVGDVLSTLIIVKLPFAVPNMSGLFTAACGSSWTV